MDTEEQEAREQRDLLILDIQTIPCTEAMGSLSEQARLHPAAQKITSIAFLRASYDGLNEIKVQECRAGGKQVSSEAELIAGFWRYFDQYKPQLITWGGRTRLFPLLRYRSMKCKLTADWLHRAGDQWSGYHTRHDLEYHVDLSDCLTDFGSSPSLELHECARILDFPFEEVNQLPCSSREKAVANVITIYRIYWRWRLYISHVSEQTEQNSLEVLRKFVNENGNERFSDIATNRLG